MTALAIGDRRAPVEFEGELIHQVSTRASGSLRWVEISLYKDTATGEYVVHTVGRSNVYHLLGTSCRTWGKRQQPGQPATVTDLPDDADPCEDCRPPWPDELADDEQVRFESPRHTVKCYPSATVTARRLARRWDKDTGGWVVQLSRPVAELLAGAAQKDPAFAGLTEQGDDSDASVGHRDQQGRGTGAASTI